ncbi:MAG TPA: hypothetical protein VGQ57_01870, partial [Polyangiaceae bacterium]|nr:hypothetical protein [Polyangiaceae bacterium]
MSFIHRLKLVHKLFGICLVAMAALAVVSAVGFHGLRVTDVSDRLVNANGVQRAQMDADMMHDAIRADVVLCSVTKSAEEVRSGLTALAEHLDRMRDDMAKVKASTEPEVRAALAATTLPLGSYFDAAAKYARATSGKTGVP